MSKTPQRPTRLPQARNNRPGTTLNRRPSPPGAGLVIYRESRLKHAFPQRRFTVRRLESSEWFRYSLSIPHPRTRLNRPGNTQVCRFDREPPLVLRNEVCSEKVPCDSKIELSPTLFCLKEFLIVEPSILSISNPPIRGHRGFDRFVRGALRRLWRWRRDSHRLLRKARRISRAWHPGQARGRLQESTQGS